MPSPQELAAETLGGRAVHSLALSPGGARLAFVVAAASQVSDGYLSRIQVIDAGGGEETWLESAGGLGALAWSEDGQALAFTAGGALWVARGPGRLERWLEAEDGAGLSAVSWIPGREELLAVRSGRALGSRPLLLNPLPYKLEGFGYRSSPNQVLRIARGSATALAARSPRGPLWAVPSPDGRRLAIGEPLARHDEIGQCAVRIVDLDAWDGEGETLPLPDVVTALAWSPDGRRLATLAQESPWGSVGHVRLTVAEPGAVSQVWDADGDRCLQGAGASGLVWQDERSILVVDSQRADLRLMRLHPDAPAEPVTQGAGSVSAFAYDRRSARLVSVWQDATHLGEVVEWSGVLPRRAAPLTALNPSLWRAPVEAYVTGFGGDPVHGFYLPPEGASGPAPCVFMIHGGPYMSFFHTVSLLAQALSRAGVGVAYLNPHGSSGYGYDFASACLGAWGETDQVDWEAWRDHLIAEGRIDPDRLAVLGASYGGYMSAWLAGHWRGLRAAVIQAPVIDQVSMLFGADLGYSWLAKETALGGLGLSDQDLLGLWHHSPLAYADRIEAKVLLLAGERDNRCPIQQAEELYVALRRRGHPVEMVVYPGDNHLLDSSRPRTRLDRVERILAFLTAALVG